jgi:alpha 1,2-mannosyltransferase
MIVWESYRCNDPVWYVTRYYLRQFFAPDGIKELYFKSMEPKTELVHKDIRFLLRQENIKVLEASSLNYTSYFQGLQDKSESTERLKYGNDFQTFMNEYAELMIDNSLSFPHPERVITNEGKPVIWDTIFVDDAYSKISFNYLDNLMEFNDICAKDLNLKHKIILNSLPTDIECPYYENNENNGYVFIGGGIYSWYSLLSIQSLYKMKSILPVELIIPKSQDYDKLLCENVLPIYNGKCIILEDFYSKSTFTKLNAKGYQLKALAILASSFSNVMYLDSDVLSVENPDILFTSEVFKKFGMITWPDFWRRTTSPKLYEILDISINLDNPIRFLNDYFTPSELLYRAEDLKNPKDRVNFHDLSGTLPDWSTEAGLLLINKKTHFNALLLSLYYNFNGPTGYYPLLSQGGAGEGDKETWPLAAHVLNLTWWQVNKQPDKTYGTWIKDVNWIVDSCIVQVDPIEDWEGVIGLIFTQEHWRNEMIGRGGYVYNYDYAFGKQGYEYAGVMGAELGNGGMASFSKNGDKSWMHMYEKGEHYSVPMSTKPRDMFYHVHSPKIDPWNYVLDDLFTDMYGKQMRNFGDIWTRLGWDFELWVWETVREDLCSWEKSLNGLNNEEMKIIQKAVKEMKCFQGRDYERVCTGENGRLDKRIEWLRKDGIDKLKNTNMSPKGWKLVGSERDKIIELITQKLN